MVSGDKLAAGQARHTSVCNHRMRYPLAAGPKGEGRGERERGRENESRAANDRGNTEPYVTRHIVRSEGGTTSREPGTAVLSLTALGISIGR